MYEEVVGQHGGRERADVLVDGKKETHYGVTQLHNRVWNEKPQHLSQKGARGFCRVAEIAGKQ